MGNKQGKRGEPGSRKHQGGSRANRPANQRSSNSRSRSSKKSASEKGAIPSASNSKPLPAQNKSSVKPVSLPPKPTPASSTSKGKLPPTTTPTPAPTPQRTSIKSEPAVLSNTIINKETPDTSLRKGSTNSQRSSHRFGPSDLEQKLAKQRVKDAEEKRGSISLQTDSSMQLSEAALEHFKSEAFPKEMLSSKQDHNQLITLKRNVDTSRLDQLYKEQLAKRQQEDQEMLRNQKLFAVPEDGDPPLQEAKSQHDK